MFVSGDQRIILTQPCSTEFGNGGFLALLNHFTVLRSSDQNQSVSYRFQSSGRWGYYSDSIRESGRRHTTLEEEN